MTSTEELNLAQLHRWFQEVWNERRLEAVDEMMAEDALAYGIESDPVGRDGFKRGWQFFIETFPDLYVTVLDAIAQGDKVACRITGVGTHEGPGLGVPATGKKVTFHAQVFTTYRDGKIVEGRNVIDMADLYRQIGATVS